MDGRLGATVNELVPPVLSDPVTTVTVEDPGTALAAIVNVAVRCVASMTATLLASTPALLNFTVDCPCTKRLDVPVIVTLIVCERSPLAGLTLVINAVPLPTAKRPTPTATSDPVLTVMVEATLEASGVTVKSALKCVSSNTDTLPTTTPGLLSVTEGVARIKCVNSPVITTWRNVSPGWALAWLTLVMPGVPLPTVNRLGPVAVSQAVETTTLEGTDAVGEPETAEPAVYETRVTPVTAKSIRRHTRFPSHRPSRQEFR
jgi:hypothetical protein